MKYGSPFVRGLSRRRAVNPFLYGAIEEIKTYYLGWVTVAFFGKQSCHAI